MIAFILKFLYRKNQSYIIGRPNNVTTVGSQLIWLFTIVREGIQYFHGCFKNCMNVVNRFFLHKKASIIAQLFISPLWVVFINLGKRFGNYKPSIYNYLAQTIP